ncbi:hypothetical protein B1F70_27705, partial [Pseudomonas syringae]
NIFIINKKGSGKSQPTTPTPGKVFMNPLENPGRKKNNKKRLPRIPFPNPPAKKNLTVKPAPPRHYLTVATRSYEEGRIRDSLSYIRKAFEEELNRLWKKIASKNLQAQISVGMRGPGDPDLMSLATGLHKFLGGKDVAVFQEAVPHLGEILGYRDKHKVEWNCLNKGTHEGDRAEEFDAVIVRRMLETVIKLDEAIEAPQA